MVYRVFLYDAVYADSDRGFGHSVILRQDIDKTASQYSEIPIAHYRGGMLREKAEQ